MNRGLDRQEFLPWSVLTVGLLFLAVIILISSPAAASTSEVTVQRYAYDKITPISNITKTYQWMKANLQVYGDGSIVYYGQGPTFDLSNLWDDEEKVNIESRNWGAVTGTDLKDLCNLNGGMEAGEIAGVYGSDSVGREFSYESIYTPNARQGPMVVTWEKNGMYPDSGYDEGMRLIMFADAKVDTYGWNRSGWHVFGNADMRDSWAPQFWYNFSGNWPSSGGTSIKVVQYIKIFSNDAVPPPVADFSANVKTSRITNGGFETGGLSGWTAVNAATATNQKKSGTYSAKLTAPAGTMTNASISQDVDLTDLTALGFWRRTVGYSGAYLQVMLDGRLIANYTETVTTTKDETLDISGYSGTHTLLFNAVNTKTGASYAVYLDDITGFAPGTSGQAPLPIQFTDLSTKMENTANCTWSWTFGDGNTSTLKNPLFTYTIPGTYPVSLTATNDRGSGSDTETKNAYITVIGTPTIDIDTTGGISNWAFTTGTHEDTTSVDLSVTSTASAWHVSVKDALDGGKPVATVGKMSEYTGSAYVTSGYKVLTNALQAKCGSGSYVTLSGSDQTVQTGTSSGTFTYDIGLKQVIAAGDPALTAPNMYRIVVTFTGATD